MNLAKRFLDLFFRMQVEIDGDEFYMTPQAPDRSVDRCRTSSVKCADFQDPGRAQEFDRRVEVKCFSV